MKTITVSAVCDLPPISCTKSNCVLRDKVRRAGQVAEKIGSWGSTTTTPRPCSASWECLHQCSSVIIGS